MKIKNIQKIKHPLAAIVTIVSFSVNVNVSADVLVSGNVGVEARNFSDSSDQGGAELIDQTLGLASELEFKWQHSDFSFDMTLFGYRENQDEQRNRFNAREMLLRYYGGDWELKAGIGQVFWGQTESQHRVDVINQTDRLGDIDGEDKLGQRMINLTLIRDYGTFDIFALPSFTERDFSDGKGRFGFSIPVANDATFEDKPAMEWAARWFYAYDQVEIALSYFDGIARDPLLVPQMAPQIGTQNEISLLPVYLPMQQFGFDSLYVNDATLWKLEVIQRKSNAEEFVAITTGFEYISVGLFGGAKDLGWIVEYSANSSDNPMIDVAQNDIFIGTRWIFNDNDSSEVLVGLSQDLDDSKSRYWSFEGSTRLTESIRLSLNAYVFNAESQDDPLIFFRDDDFIQLELTYHF